MRMYSREDINAKLPKWNHNAQVFNGKNDTYMNGSLLILITKALLCSQYVEGKCSIPSRLYYTMMNPSAYNLTQILQTYISFSIRTSLHTRKWGNPRLLTPIVLQIMIWTIRKRIVSKENQETTNKDDAKKTTYSFTRREPAKLEPTKTPP